LCREQALPAGAVDCERRLEGSSLDAAIARALAAPRPVGGPSSPTDSGVAVGGAPAAAHVPEAATAR
jgi:hypothetical protein